MSNRRRRRFHGLASLLLVTSSCLLHVLVDAVPTPNLQLSPAAEQEHPSNNAVSGGMFHSIGFRQCGSSALSSSPDTSQSGTVSDASSINLSSLGILYDATSNTISLTAEGSAEREVDASSAHILLTAYDRVLYNQTIDLSAPIITRFTGNFSFLKTFAAPPLLQSQLPKQLFYVPALEAVAAIQLYNRQGNAVFCTAVPLTNTVSATSPSITIASVSLTAASVALIAITGMLATFSSAAVITSIPLTATGVGGSSGSAGSANPSGGLSPSVWDVVSFCQFIAMSGSLNLNYPELFRQWTLNFGWSIGLVQVEGWNRAINGLRAGASKTPPSSEGQDEAGTKIFVSQHLESMSTSGIGETHINRVVPFISKRQVAPPPNPPSAPVIAPIQVFIPGPMPQPAPGLPLPAQAPSTPAVPALPLGAALLPDSHDTSLMNRAGDLSGIKLIESLPSTAAIPSPTAVIPTHTPSTSWSRNNRPLALHGLTSFGQRLDIPAENMFMTSLFLFLILLLATSLLAFVLRLSLEGYAYFCPGKFTKFRRRFGSYYLGNMLRVMLLSYFAVATMAFYQLTLQDTWIMTLLAVLSLLLFFGLVTFITLRLRRAGGTSLFFDERLKSRYGVLYDQYFLSTYWFFVPVLGYQILKAAIVGLGQGVTADSMRDTSLHHHHGSSESWAQTSLLLLVEVFFAALLIWKHPFADKASNRLNSVLSCVRVLNVVLLAILIEDAAISTVSRTVIGMVMTGTQAVAMLALGILIFYQLGKVLWRLGMALKANKNSQKSKKQEEEERASKSMDRSEDVLVVSVPKDEKDEDENPGRSASEQTRVGGDESMTSLVNLMNIGSNPTIQYTPASDDEDDVKRNLGNEDKEEVIHVLEADYLRFKRVLTQSVHSESSHILDYYNPSYLPSSFRAVSRQQQHQQEQYDLHHGKDDNIQIDMDAGAKTDHNLDVAKGDNAADQGATKNEIWVQSAYMTRRRSEAIRLRMHRGTNSVSHILRSIEDDQFSHQNRRRPASVGGARQSVKSITSATPAKDLLLESSLESNSSVTFAGSHSSTFDMDPPVGRNLLSTDAHHVDTTLNDDIKDPKQTLDATISNPVATPSTETLHDPPPTFISSSIPTKRLTPGLKIITALRPPCPPPQIPLPTLPPTPFSAGQMTESILCEDSSIKSIELQQQRAMKMKQPTTPDSDGSCTPLGAQGQILGLEDNAASQRRQLK
ncbi:hypothetical protein BG011_002349 [Mortierella polycephala]|uniref:TRP C-terminal domain-containing protein n=1 Tax=Mortierella polycephala TaxID=41804 RepID=A0A9P6Q4N0_9FUNG|nr:hypothetical protein BG011_002349 [Mortierella polycephala]